MRRMMNIMGTKTITTSANTKLSDHEHLYESRNVDGYLGFDVNLRKRAMRLFGGGG